MHLEDLSEFALSARRGNPPPVTGRDRDDPLARKIENF
ncbi:hypothetical protein TIFTF001_025277 [Ficus carica]|uniref:Uncharacterized protein n=1 Tax=Ficus carica TaxID=3494 RepID=A0AA88AIM3_FICCA|nr:hypothetical protein TIFTF001_025277 [Ficus carica]